jgi:D-3-phosphoglycerate dehydrogenase
MLNLKIGILESEYFHPEIINQLYTLGDVFFYDKTSDLAKFISNKDILFIRLRYKIDDSLISGASNLKIIVSPTTGTNHINISNDFIKVLTLKEYTHLLTNVRATPEHILGLLIALLRRYKFSFGEIGIDNNRYDYMGNEIYNSKIGIIGLGRIGSIISKYFLALGAKVSAFDIRNDINLISDQIVLLDSIEELIVTNEIIILTANFSPENKDFIKKSHFDLMDGKYFINASRAELCNYQDLRYFLSKNRFLGVAIDVYEDETQVDRTILDAVQVSSNVIFTPHIGGLTKTSLEFVESLITKLLFEQLNLSVSDTYLKYFRLKE